MNRRAFKDVVRAGMWIGAALILAGVLVYALFQAHDAEAARNSAGTYSPPAGQPVVQGTVISTTVFNNLVSDVGSEITNSLERNGRGAMLAPLQHTNGTNLLPSVTFSSETSSGLYRAGLNDIRMQVGAVNAQKWSSVSPGSTFPIGISVTQTASNGNAVNGTGNGTGAGLNAVGGGTDGVGVAGAGGATNGIGVKGTGSGTGVGIWGVGTGTAAGAKFENGTAASGATRRDAVQLVNGDLNLDGVTDPNAGVAIKNRLTTANIVKAWGDISTNSLVVHDGFNITSLSCTSDVVTVNLAQAMSSTAYGVTATLTGGASAGDTIQAGITSSSAFTVKAFNQAGAAITLCSTNREFTVIAMGKQ